MPDQPADAVPAATPTLAVAGVQMVSATDPAANRAAAARLIARAAEGGARVVVLPEYFCLLGRRDTDKVDLREAAGAGPLQDFLAEQAARHRIWLIGGTVPIATSRPTRVRNTCLVHGPDGRPIARYDKIHLFGFQRGAERFDESATIEAGRTPVVIDIEGWRVGLSVCYDLRFPELYRVLAPCDLIVVPSAFTHTTGQAHWEVLLRARAIENQCYVLAPAQGGLHENGRRTWGHSLLADPWGDLLQVLPEGEGLVAGVLHRQRILEVRQSLPALAHRIL
ncbi:MAG: carbon-nitrogen hydrolase family protein [Betaproteobacteria bacterium]|nr:carbon-nitrogen hydrolase family protein [Betaproteobacteria bacterium]